MESTFSLLIASSMALLSVAVLAERAASSAQPTTAADLSTPAKAELADVLTNKAVDLARLSSRAADQTTRAVEHASLPTIDAEQADDDDRRSGRVDSETSAALDRATDRNDDLAFATASNGGSPLAPDEVAVLEAVLDRSTDRADDLRAAYAIDVDANETIADRLIDGAADASADREANYPVDVGQAEQAIADQLTDLTADQASDRADYAQPIAEASAVDPETTSALATLQRKLANHRPLLPEEVPFASFLLQSSQRGAGLASTRPMPMLVDRLLSAGEKAEPLGIELRDAIERIQPIFDPTRVDDTDAPVLRIRTGTATMTSVFGDGWHVASDDPTINVRAARFGLLWRAAAVASCEGYTKLRRHEVGDVTLDGLSQADCDNLQARLSRGYDDAAPIPLASAALAVPVFAAPLPGGRTSSEAFWVAQRARIKAIEARLESKWQLPTPTVEQVGLRF